MGAPRRVVSSKALRLGVAGLVVVAGVIVAVEFAKGTPTYPVNVVYSSAPGSSPVPPSTSSASRSARSPTCRTRVTRST